MVNQTIVRKVSSRLSKVFVELSSMFVKKLEYNFSTFPDLIKFTHALYFGIVRLYNPPWQSIGSQLVFNAFGVDYSVKNLLVLLSISDWKSFTLISGDSPNLDIVLDKLWKHVFLGPPNEPLNNAVWLRSELVCPRFVHNITIAQSIPSAHQSNPGSFAVTQFIWKRRCTRTQLLHTWTIHLMDLYTTEVPRTLMRYDKKLFHCTRGMKPRKGSTTC